MNRWTRIAAAPVLALAIASCGTTQELSSAPTPGPAAPAAPAAPAQGGGAKGTSLGDLVSIASGFAPQRGSVKLDTKVYDSSVYASFGCRNASAWEFDLNREYTKLSGVVGVDDYSIADDEATLKVIADGQPKGQVTVKLGTTQPLEVDVTNVLRLRVELTRTSAACDHATGYSTNVAIGNATLAK